MLKTLTCRDEEFRDASPEQTPRKPESVGLERIVFSRVEFRPEGRATAATSSYTKQFCASFRTELGRSPSARELEVALARYFGQLVETHPAPESLIGEVIDTVISDYRCMAQQTPYCGVVIDEYTEAITGNLHRFSEPLRTIINCHFVRRQSVAEIAYQLGMSPARVEKILKKIKAAVEQRLRDCAKTRTLEEVNTLDKVLAWLQTQQDSLICHGNAKRRLVRVAAAAAGSRR